MDLAEKRKYFLALIDLQEKKIADFLDNYRGPGIAMRARKIMKYRWRYVKHGLARLGLWPVKNEKVTAFWGKKFDVALGDDLMIYLFGMPGGLEYKLGKFLIKNLKPDDVFYDIGANYGFYTFLANEFVSSGEIHAFEPGVEAFRCLVVSVAGNKRVFLRDLALSDNVGKIGFYDYSGCGSGVSTTMDVVAEHLSSAGINKYKKTEVACTTLDEYVSRHKPPTVIKMDIEGGESRVIDGGAGFLRKLAPIVCMEVWAGKDGEDFSMKAVRKLWDLGYESYLIDNDGNLTPAPANLTAIEKEGSDNYVFKKP